MPAQARSAASRSICSAAATTAAENSTPAAAAASRRPRSAARIRSSWWPIIRRMSSGIAIAARPVAVVDLPAPAALDEDRAPDQVVGHADDEEGIAAGARVDHSGHRVEGAIRRETTGQVLAHGCLVERGEGDLSALTTHLQRILGRLERIPGHERLEWPARREDQYPCGSG